MNMHIVEIIGVIKGLLLAYIYILCIQNIATYILSHFFYLVVFDGISTLPRSYGEGVPVGLLLLWKSM